MLDRERTMRRTSQTPSKETLFSKSHLIGTWRAANRWLHFDRIAVRPFEVFTVLQPVSARKVLILKGNQRSEGRSELLKHAKKID